MKRTKPFLLLLLCLLPSGVLAGEPWNDKPAPQWTEKDVKRILENSPWTRVVTVPATWLRLGAQGAESTVTTRIESNPNRPLERPEDVVPVHDRIWNQFANLMVRWNSSKAVRLALARSEALRAGRSGNVPAVSSLPETEEYELLLVGDVLAPLPNVTNAELRQRSVLRILRTGHEFAPARVETERRADGQIVQVRFFFPRRDREGAAILGGKDGRLEFESNLLGQSFRVRFDLNQMRLQGARDL